MAAAAPSQTQDSGRARAEHFSTLPPLINQRPETSIANLFPNSDVRNRPLTRKSNVRVINASKLGQESQSSDTLYEARHILTSLLETLKESHIPGPRLIRLRPESGEFCEVVGEGAQCDVLAASTGCEDLLKAPFGDRDTTDLADTLKACQLIAVKRTKVYRDDEASHASDEDGTKTKGLRDQFEFARRDIMTLCHENFRRHRNIVKLIAWGLCLDTLEDPGGDAPRIPLLVLERANGNLSEYLQFERLYVSDHKEFATEQCKLCLDIGRGLEAIHKENMTHGDLKPSNILIFQSDIGATAKLCDFGLAIEEKSGENAFVDYHGTPGWIPPETFEPVRSASLVLCDIFAYGLIVWCVSILDWESPIEGLPPKRLIEQELYHRAWRGVQAAPITRQGQDTSRLLRVLRACLHIPPSMRERRPWLYLDRREFYTIATPADPTQSSASLLAFDAVMRVAERLSNLSNRVLDSVRVAWLPMLRSCLHSIWDLLSWPRWMFYHCKIMLSTAGRSVARLWHSKSLPPRQKAYEHVFRLHVHEVSAHDFGRRMNDLSQISRIQTRDNSYRTIHLDLESLLKALAPTHASNTLVRRMISPGVDLVYAYARLRSKLESPGSVGSELQSMNAVLLGFQKAQLLGLAPLAWLCRGPFGRSEISGNQRCELWQVILETEMLPDMRLKLVALLLQMGASPQDKVSSNSTETAFRHVLLKVMAEYYVDDYDRSFGTVQLVCSLFRRAAVNSGTHEARFFLSGELPDEEDIDEGDMFSTTVLHEAISACCIRAVRYFLSLGFPIYVLDHQGQTPLQLAESLCKHSPPGNRSEKILKLIQEIIAVTNTNEDMNLPLGWTVKRLSSGVSVYHEIHTDSVTFKAPNFSLWEERRLTLGFKKISAIGQRFLVDIVRFVIAKDDGSKNLALEKDFLFDDSWFQRDIELTEARDIEIPKVVYIAQDAGRVVFRVLVSSHLNILLLATPVIPIGVARSWHPNLLVALSSIAIVPLFSIQCFAARELAAKVSRTYRTAVTAVPESMVELTFGIITLFHQEWSMMNLLVLGVVLNNILLITGMCFVAAGIRYAESAYDVRPAQTRGSLLILSMAFLILVKTYAMYTYNIAPLLPSIENGVTKISIAISVVLLVLYLLYNCFRYATHTAFYDEHWVGDYDEESRDDENSPPRDETLGTILAPIPAIFFVLVTIALIVPCALVITTRLPLVSPRTAALYPLFIIPVCLKAPLHLIALRSALTLDMEGMLSITIDGALRTLYLLCPLFVILSRIFQDQPWNLSFDLDQIMMTALAVFIIAPIMSRGASTFLDGGLLLAICVIVYLEQGIQISERPSQIPSLA